VQHLQAVHLYCARGILESIVGPFQQRYIPPRHIPYSDDFRVTVINEKMCRGPPADILLLQSTRAWVLS
jgi:hypothetical protein